MLLAIGALGAAQPAAADEPSGEITIVRTSASPQLSGSELEYVINYTCSAVANDHCDDFIITIPLDATTTPSMQAIGQQAWGYQLVSAPGMPTNGAIVGSNYVISFTAPVPAGISQTVGLKVTPPNFWTANNTQWELLPTASGTNIVPFVAPDPAVSVATAGPAIEINKTVRGGAESLQPGSTVTYELNFGCGPMWALMGTLALTSGTVEDVLPAGLSYVSANPIPSQVTGQSVRWDFTGDTLPKSCRGVSGVLDPSLVYTVTVLVDDQLADEVLLENVATFSGSPLGETETVIATDELELPVIAQPDPWAGGSISKTSGAALGWIDRVPATYPGNWIQPISASPNLGSPSVEGYFVANVGYGTAGFRSHIVDPLPCLDNSDGATPPVYSSPAPSDPVCQNPAFHSTAVMIAGWNTPGAGYPEAYLAGWRPTATLTDGTVVELEKTIESDIVAWVPGAYFPIPASLIGQVAVVTLPQSTHLRAAASTLYIAGYADASLEAKALLRNTVSATPYWADLSEPAGETREASASMVIAPPVVRLGISKYGPNWATSLVQPAGSPVGTSFSLALRTPVAINTPVVVTDLLPLGITWNAQPTVTWSAGSLGLVESTVEVIDNFSGSGRQLIRMTIPGGTFGPGAFALSSPPLNYFTNPMPASYLNTAQIFAPGANVDSVCMIGEPRSEDPLDLDGSGSGESRHCEAAMTIRTVGSGLPAFSVQKSVQGDVDPLPRFYPAYGVVNPNGGSVRYEVIWTNTGGTDLNSAVVYDVLPHIGDTGTLNVSTPRDSGFTPVLQAMEAAPSDVTIYYSGSTNACRPELVDIPGCIDDWSTTPPGGELAAVRALKFTSTAQYLSGEGFRVGFTMAVDPLDESELIAWNNPAARASYPVDGGNSSTALLPAEGPKVGLQGAHPAISLLKTDLEGNDANDRNNPVKIAAGTETEMVFTVRNEGNQPLVDVTISDAITNGTATLNDLQCDFLGDGTQLGTHWDGPFAVGAEFVCTATLSALEPGVEHQNVATVTASGAYLDEPVEDSDPYNAYVEPSPDIDIVKTVNGHDANAAPGALIAVGDPASWQYAVSNTGDVPLSAVEVTDNNGTPDDDSDDWAAEYLSGDINENQLLDTNEIWIFVTPESKRMTVEAGSYGNLGTVTALDQRENPVTADDPAHLFGAEPSISIVKTVNGEDANEAPGVAVAPGSTMQFVYRVTNTGNVPVTELSVVDDQGIAVLCLDETSTVVTELAVGEVIDCTATQLASFTGQYTNIGTVTARGPDTVDGDGEVKSGAELSAEDPANAHLATVPVSPVPPALGKTGVEITAALAVALLALAAGLVLWRRRKSSIAAE